MKERITKERREEKIFFDFWFRFYFDCYDFEEEVCSKDQTKN